MSHLQTAPLFLLGMPRSGTTWLSQILESSPHCIVRLSPNYSYPLKNRLTVTSTAADWAAVFDEAIATHDAFMTQNWRRETRELPLFPSKSVDELKRLVLKDTRFHDLYLEGMTVFPAAKTVYIVRHPAAALWSWRSCKEFPEGADFRREWRTGECRKREGPGEYWGFDDWKSLTQLYCDLASRHPHRYLIVRYENFVSQALREAEQLFHFAEVPMSPAIEEFVRHSQSLHDERPYAVFKRPTVRDAWKRDFPADILAEIDRDLAGTPLEAFLR